MDEELVEFLKWLGIRHSEGSDRIYIQKFLEVFSEDYLIQRSDFEDNFDHTKETPDSDDLQPENNQQEEEP